MEKVELSRRGPGNTGSSVFAQNTLTLMEVIHLFDRYLSEEARERLHSGKLKRALTVGGITALAFALFGKVGLIAVLIWFIV